jgi:hypothetical protein
MYVSPSQPDEYTIGDGLGYANRMKTYLLEVRNNFYNLPHTGNDRSEHIPPGLHNSSLTQVFDSAVSSS